MPNAVGGSDQARGAMTRRRLLIAVGIAVGVLFGVLAAILAITAVAPVSTP